MQMLQNSYKNDQVCVVKLAEEQVFSKVKNTFLSKHFNSFNNKIQIFIQRSSIQQDEDCYGKKQKQKQNPQRILT